METPTEEKEQEQTQDAAHEEQAHPDACYLIQFRPGDQIFSGVSRIQNLKKHELVMAQSDHGLEPAIIHGKAMPCPDRQDPEKLGSFLLARRGTREEIEKYERLLEREQEAFATCRRLIEKHRLPMKLIKVERYFNGSKVIFFFTAESRVDFRELVKDLVQEFRTRVEIRQIGVRHETKMIGGIGCCGRELCCSSFIKNFAPVSIKMAKEQGLPLNPAKISGICNRLLCCLTYEYDTYHSIRKNMPKAGKQIKFQGQIFKVTKVNILDESIEAVSLDETATVRILTKNEWKRAEQVKPSPAKKESAAEKTKKADSPESPEGADE